MEGCAHDGLELSPPLSTTSCIPEHQNCHTRPWCNRAGYCLTVSAQEICYNAAQSLIAVSKRVHQVECDQSHCSHCWCCYAGRKCRWPKNVHNVNDTLVFWDASCRLSIFLKHEGGQGSLLLNRLCFHVLVFEISFPLLARGNFLSSVSLCTTALEVMVSCIIDICLGWLKCGTQDMGSDSCVPGCFVKQKCWKYQPVK